MGYLKNTGKWDETDSMWFEIITQKDQALLMFYYVLLMFLCK
jgi:hypothetical protein